MNVNNPIYKSFSSHVLATKSYQALGMTLFVGKCKDMFVSKYKYMLPKFQKYLSLLEEIMSVKCKMNAGST